MVRQFLSGRFRKVLRMFMKTDQVPFCIRFHPGKPRPIPRQIIAHVESIQLLIVVGTLSRTHHLRQIGKVQLHVNGIAGTYHQMVNKRRHRDGPWRVWHKRKRKGILIDGRCLFLRNPVIKRNLDADFRRIRIHFPVGHMPRNYRRPGIIGLVPLDILRLKDKGRFINPARHAPLFAG